MQRKKYYDLYELYTREEMSEIANKEGFLFVETSNGEMLKRIGRAARIDMEQNFGIKINLKTWVKVKQDWLDNDSIVSKFKLK